MPLSRKNPLRRTPLKRSQKPIKRSGIKKKDINALLGEGLLSKASSLKPRQKPIRKRSKRNAGWWDVALEIWNEREHYCEVTGVWLGDNPLPIFFSHLLPRSTYPDFKRDKRNIRLKSAAAHRAWHQSGPEVLQAYPEWRKTTNLYFSLRDEANDIDVK